MEWETSIAGSRLAGPSGILDLMKDLGEALTTNQDAIMMGGGNPAQIGAMQAIWREEMATILQDPDRFGDVLANYDPPAGNPRFRESLARFLNAQCGWELTADNIAITAGGQTALFYLLNLFSGHFSSGRKRILLPLMPEYIGYANQGIEADIFATCPAKIEETADHRFKYRVDFERLEITDEIGALCVSRPTNPSANVLTDEEIQKLAAMAGERGIPLILDSAYGVPFPGVIFGDAQPFWNDDVILTLSLSKLGLPGTRTGIVVAREEVISRMAALNSVIGLANNNIGQALVRQLVESGRLANLCQDVVRPFYRERCQQAVRALHASLPPDLPWSIHEPEGAFFIWLRLQNMPITSRELYERLKERGVLVVPGEFFFFGMDQPWSHSTECLRLSYTQPLDRVERGLAIIGEELRKAYA